MKKLAIRYKMHYCMLLLIGLFAFLHSANAQLTNYGFETGNFSGWSASSGTSISTGVSYNSWTVNPADSYMATIDPNSNLYRGTAETTLGLQAGALVASNASLFNSSTNFATLNQQFGFLAANQTISIYWNFIARDYAPFNDGAIATLVGPSYQQIKLLAVTANAYGDAGAVVTGSYGSAGWHKVTFTSGAAGIYKLGFASFNTGDQILSPILIIDNAPGGNFQPGQPIIVTTAVSSVASTSAVSGGNVTSDGGAGVTARGVVWNTTGSPTITDPHTSDGSGLGSFTSNLTGLSPGTSYYVRSYAVNSAGTVYGGQITFTTVNPIPANPTSISVSANPICNGTSTQLTANGIVGTVYWYTGSCGGTSVGTGNSITVSPGVTTTYYAKNFSNGLYSNGCASATVTVNSAPTISCPSNITVSNTPGQCGANVTFPAATATGSPAPTITYSQQSGSVFPMGTTAVTATATNSCGTVICTFNVTVTGIDTDGDGIPDDCDNDADNDGIPNSAECNQSNFYWSSPPTVSGNTATGTINGIGYTYTSSSPVTTTTSMYAHSNFPASYNVPNSNPTIQNIYVTNNTLTFASPMKNPVLVFASIGQGGLSVPISFSAPIQVVWSQNVVLNSSTQITGTEGYAIIRLMGTFTSVSFNYLTAENWCNFAFGADFQTCGDTDADGIPDYLDTDSDNDGCLDAIEGSMNFSLSQTQNGRLVGAVNSQGIPVIAGAGQGIGTSKSYNANCSCQPGIDKTPPVALAQNVIVQLDGSGNGSTTAALVNNGSSDACGIKSMVLSKSSFDCSNIGSNTVTLTVTDNNNNVSTTTAIVTVQDKVSPVINCLSNQTIASCAEVIPDFTTSATVSDNCGSGSLTITQSPAAGTTIASGATVSVTLTAVDASNNSATCTFTVTRPNITPVANNDAVTVCAGSSVTFNVLGNDSHPQGAALTVSDNTNPTLGTLVKNADNTFTYTSVTPSPSPLTFTYTIKANDGVIPFSGNNHYYEWVPANGITWQQAKAQAASKSFNGMQGYLVTVTSATEMAFVTSKLKGQGWMGASDLASEGTWRWVTGPEGQENGGLGRYFSNQFKTGNCSANTAPGINGNYANWSGGEPNDCGANIGQFAPTNLNRGGEHYAHFISNGLWNDYPNSVGGSITGYVVEYGGLDSCTPVLTATATVTITVNPKPVLSAVTTNVMCVGGNDGAIDLSVTSGQTPYTYSWSNGATTQDVNSLPTGTYTVTVTTGNGCSTQGSYVINQVDNVLPVALAKNVTIQLDASGNGSVTAAQVNNGSSDACGIKTMVLSKSAFNCADISTNPNVVTLTVTDNNNNVSTATAEVTVVDATAPAAVAQNVTVQLDASGNGSTTAALVNNGSSDACGIKTLELSKTAFTCSDIATNPNVVTLTVTDNNGNVSTATANVTVVDPVAPVAVAQNVTVQLDATGNGSTTAALVNNGSSDACGIKTLALSKTAFTCSDIATNPNVVTLTVTDNNGNVSTATANVTVVDAIAPVAVAQNVTVQLDANGNGSTIAALVNNGSSDACGIKTLALSKTAFTCSDIATNPNVVTLTVTDNNGNVSTATANVTVVDAIAPVAVAQNVTVQLDATGNGSTTAALVNNGSSDACGIKTLELSKTAFTCSDIATNPNVVTLTVTDNNGNVSTATANVTVVDAIAPVAVAQNVTVQLDATGNGSTTAALVNNGSSDACGIKTLELSKTAFTCSDIATNPNVVTLTVTDNNGNVSTATATVTVEDKIAPILTVPVNIVKLNDQGVCGAVVNIGQATATDNCSVATISNNAPAFFPVGITTVTWTVVDVNGNTTTGTQTVEITNNAPVISGLTVSPLLQLGVTTLASATHADNNLVAATWNWGDGMSTPGTISGSQLSGNHVYSQTGLFNVTLTIEDACGKSDTKTYSYVVIYNPCNGFVTGGGNFTTPKGAYSANTSLTGKSNYGFEVKYEEGKKAPKGEFEFQFTAAKFKMKATTFDWLMVNGDMAVMRGNAKVNEKDGYHFIASVVDGKTPSQNGTDYLRLIVWDNAGNVLYDNQMSDPDYARALAPISHGQIVIHKYKHEKCFGDDFDHKDEMSHDIHMDDENSSQIGSDDASNNGNKNDKSSKTPILVEMTVYPNPLVNNRAVDITIKNFGNTEAKVELSYINGRVVYSTSKVEFSAGKAKIDFSKAKLTPGNYLLTVSENGTMRVGVKQIIVL
jgi:ethanolamine utilization microcompartment shell protein EutS